MPLNFSSSYFHVCVSFHRSSIICLISSLLFWLFCNSSHYNSKSTFYFLTLVIYLLCMLCKGQPRCTREGQRAASWSQFSPATMSSQASTPASSLSWWHFCLLSHLTKTSVGFEKPVFSPSSSLNMY